MSARRGPRSRSRALLLCLGLGLALGGAGACDRASPASPEAALTAFIELMERGRTDARALQQAYQLLDVSSQAELSSRARQASTLARRDFAPWQMFAQGRSRLRVSPDSMSARIVGDTAMVTVQGGKGAQVAVPMVRQEGRWRVQLVIPPVVSPSAEPAPPAESAPDTDVSPPPIVRDRAGTGPRP